MGRRYEHWRGRSEKNTGELSELKSILLHNRSFLPIDKLQYGDFGLERAAETIFRAIENKARIALYADYDVDGTMSCVSWIWFFKAIGYQNYVHYIPCRFREGYGVNLGAIRHLIENEKARVVITMDTGITANEEARYCLERGVEFICTDHHKIQPNLMPDCILVNPRLHADREYQQLCGCGITFVLLRRLAAKGFAIEPPLWTDLLALTGMATICDVVPLNSVNHHLAKLGVSALLRSQRPILKKLRESASAHTSVNEHDVGFRLGPRINAVGRMGHANKVIDAFVSEEASSLVQYMENCNRERKSWQEKIITEARLLLEPFLKSPILFLGGHWHPGVVGIAASRIAEEAWKPTWLFHKENGIAKGSARSIPGFDVTDAMNGAHSFFTKYGGHQAAAGFTFDEKNEPAIRAALETHAEQIKAKTPELWKSQIYYDCHVPLERLDLELAESLEGLRPFGNSFEEPHFRVESTVKQVRFLEDAQGKRKHTCFQIESSRGGLRVMAFNHVICGIKSGDRVEFILSAMPDSYLGRRQVKLIAHDVNPL